MYIRNRKSIQIITPQSAATQLISTADMKSFMRVDTSADDTLIDDFVKTATQTISDFLRRSILTQTLNLTMDNFGGDRRFENTVSEGWYDLPKSLMQGNLNDVYLPFAPIVSITTIKTTDQNNIETTLSSATYSLDPDGRIFLNTGYSWPTALRDKNSVAVRYVAGYGYTNVPLPIKQAIRQYAAAMYDCRRMCEMSQEVMDMISAYRILDPMGLV